MKKIIIVTTIGILLVFGIISAGVLNYYGKIVGNIQVQGPIFYADSTSLGGVYYKMKINEQGTGSVSLVDGNRVLFVTYSLGISSWYPAKWDVYINISSPTIGGLSAIRVKKVSQNLVTETTICEWTGINLNPGVNLIQKNCTTFYTISFDTTDRLGLEIVGAGNLTYTIYTDGSTRIEVSPA